MGVEKHIATPCLLPCPFCGSEAKERVLRKIRIAECTRCGVSAGINLWNCRGGMLDKLTPSAITPTSLERELGAAMVDALQGDFASCAALSKSVKIEMVDGAPIVRFMKSATLPTRDATIEECVKVLENNAFRAAWQLVPTLRALKSDTADSGSEK